MVTLALNSGLWVRRLLMGWEHLLRGGAPPWRFTLGPVQKNQTTSEIKRRTRVVGIFPNDAAIIRLVGALPLEQQKEWPLEGRRVHSELSMAKLDNTREPYQNHSTAALAAAALPAISDQVTSLGVHITPRDKTDVKKARHYPV